MRLKLRKQRDGELRPRWYGAASINGQEREVPLCRWKGTPPDSGSVSDKGDVAFEVSRAEAMGELDQIVTGERSKEDQAALAARVHRSRYKTPVRRIRLADLPAAWATFPRKREPVPAHAENIRRILQTFVDYMKATAPKVTETGAVSATHIQSFMKNEEARGVSARTWNIALSTLRGVFKKLDPNSPGFTQFLQNQPKKDEDTVHRTPFSGDELAAIMQAAKTDPIMEGLVVTAATTAMRRGDVCNLKWKDVDLVSGFVTVKTAKTGGTIEIPIFPALRTVLEGRKRSGLYVFPEAVKIYKERPESLNDRLDEILGEAGLPQPGRRKATKAETADPEKIKASALAHIARAGWTEKRAARAREIVERYASGQSVKSIAKETGMSQGSISGHLGALAKITGLAIVRRFETTDDPQEQVEKGQRIRRGSVRGWHSFRTTWITLALSAGIPMELVRRVTGHASVDVVLKNYFRPGRDQFRDALANSTMPAALIGKGSKGGARKAIQPEQVSDLANRLTAKTWKAIQAELLTLAG